MKVFKYSILAIFAILFINTASGEDQYAKKYQKAYRVDSLSEFRIANTFGNIDIKNTTEDKISIIAEIIVKARSQEQANKVFEKINIDIGKENNKIHAKTSIEEMKGLKSKFEINYKVLLPSYLNITLVNKYGNVTIDELSGKTNIAVKYGALNANRILDKNTKPLSTIELAYSEPSKIKEFNWGKIAIRYSKLKIEEGKALAISSKYSELGLGMFSSIVLDASYDDVTINSVKNLVVDSKYTDIAIDKIYNKFKLVSKYGDVDVDKVSRNFENIDIKCSYGDVNIDIDDNADYKLDGDINFGDIDYPEMKIIERDKDNHCLYIRGVVGNNPKGNVKVKCDYGDVNID